AVSPKDPNTAVIAAGDYHQPGGCYLYATRDGGLSWSQTSDSLLPPGASYCIDRPLFSPYISPAFAANGTLYVGMGAAGTAGFPNGPSSAAVARTTDLGLTHRTTVVQGPRTVTGTYMPTKSGGLTGTLGQGTSAMAMTQDRTSELAVDPTDPNRVYMGWEVTTTAPTGSSGFLGGGFSLVQPTQTVVSTSNDGGATWGAPVNLTATLAGTKLGSKDGLGPADLLVGGDGTVYAFAQDSPSSPPGSSSKPVSNTVMLTSTDHGKTWKAGAIDYRMPYQSLSDPRVAMDPRTGELYLAESLQGGPPGSGGSGPETIFVSHSTDGGHTWSVPVDVVDPSARDAYDQVEPGISVAPDGRVDVAWQDFRSDPYYRLGPDGKPVAGSTMKERYYDIYGASSSDHGSTWTANYRLSGQTIDSTLTAEVPDAANGPVGVASTNQAAYATWGNPAPGGDAGQPEDAYFTRADFTSPLSGGTSGNSTSRNVLWGLIGGGSALILAGLVLVGTRLRRRPGS
ncbi:MAG TPA: hypothetical protein VG205_10505, partial [Acidimicrobiales bacterium]|nr:hypothetical protein [Acidimicrobiales bacterium]